MMKEWKFKRAAKKASGKNSQACRRSEERDGNEREIWVDGWILGAQRSENAVKKPQEGTNEWADKNMTCGFEP